MSRWDEGFIIEPDALLTNEQLNRMSEEEIWAFFRPHMKQTTRVVPRPVAEQRYVHLFPALHAKRPACGRRLPFEPMDCTFSRRHATCPGCIEAAKEAA